MITPDNYKTKKYTLSHKEEKMGIRINAKIGGQKILIFDPETSHEYSSYGIGNKPVFQKPGETHADQYGLSLFIDGKLDPNSYQMKYKEMFDHFDKLIIDYCVENVDKFKSLFGITDKMKKEMIPEIIEGKMKSSFRPSDKAIKEKVTDPKLNLYLGIGQYGKDLTTGKFKPPTIEVFANKKFKCIQDDKEIRANEKLPWDYIYSKPEDGIRYWKISPTITWEGAFINSTMIAPSYNCPRVRVCPDASNSMSKEELDFAKRMEKEQTIEDGIGGIDITTDK